MALERIILNIIPAGDMPVFHCSQYETGRPIIIDLVSSDDDAFLVGEGVTVELHCRKCDDNIVTMEADEVDNNTVTFVTSEQLTACPGDNLCELVLYSGTDPVQTLATLNFILHVEPDPLAGGLTSDSKISNLTQQIKTITQEVIGEDYYNKTEVDGLISSVQSQIPTKTSDLTNDSGFITPSDLTPYAKTADLATVATTGDYDDLLNKPTIPDAQIQSDWEQADNTKVDYIKNKPDIDAMIAAALLAVMPVGTETGPIATFDTEIAASLVNVSCDVVATGGNGTPDSPIPINGYSSANITRCGVNLLHINSRIDRTDAHHINYTSDDNYIYLNGTKSGGGYADMQELTITLPAGTYYLRAFVISGTASNTVELYAYNGVTNITGSLLTGEKTLTLTELTTFRFRFAIWADGTVCTNYKIGIAISTASISEYSEYTGNTYTIAFGQTVYGGVLDVTSGKLTVTHANIASYNGESINEPWLSSMDTYVPNTTPTTGAQVVYPLTTPIDIDITPEVISAVVGTNNVYSDTNGDTTVQFKDSIQHYIDTRV